MRLQNFQNTGEKNGEVWETFGNSILLLSYLVFLMLLELNLVVPHVYFF